MMKSAVAVDQYGKITKVFVWASDELISANVHADDIVLFVDPPEDRSSYWDFANESWKSIGTAPSPHHTFDYTTKQWIDPRTIDEIKAQRWAEIKSQRDQIEFGGFEFEGNIYDSNQVSQGRILGAASTGVDQTWTLADNTKAELSASQLQQLYAALQAHIASVHERGRIARQLVFEAETREQVEAVQL